MRIASSMYYKNIYGENSSQLSKSLFDVNKQIASGLKIQYAYEGIRTFTETMRLDNEITTLDQTKNSVQSALKFSDQTDSVLNEFETSMNRARTLLLNAANATNSETSLDAIAHELRGLEEHFKSLSNTSVNGQYLFSGSAVDTKPIASDGSYRGNDAILKAFTGSGTSQQYNISGAELFLGEEQTVKREITTNIMQYNLSTKYPDFTDSSVSGTAAYITSDDTIRDLMGDTDSMAGGTSYFYVSGTQSDGTSFKEKISMSDGDKIDSLLKRIGDIYGNTADLDVVNVSLNPYGQIVIEDKMRGSSKIDFHMVGATDFSGGAAADVINIDALGDGETNFDKIMLGTSTATNPNLFVKEFVKSSLSAADSVAAGNSIEGTLYDRVEFTKDGAMLSASTPQIIKETNEFATASTKLSEVASGSLDGKSFVFEGVNVYGFSYIAQIDLAVGGSTFSVGGNTYDIFDMGSPRAAVSADDMTYKQLMDVMNMIAMGNLPAANNAVEYDKAIETADLGARTFLSYDGKITFEEIGSGNTQATMALYDANSGDFSAAASIMTFNTNNALTVRDSKTDFFKTLDAMISAVENHKLYPDGSSGDVRNVGIENAVKMMDDLQDHIFRSHSQVGAQSNALTDSLERTEMLKMSSVGLRSSVIDTDLAEAYLTLEQLNTNYKAMLSTVTKVSELSLVNYL
ncbi:MAG: flagellar biosynthesis protein FlgL [Sulfurimonas sp.]|uniref:flagellin N-terminal helical domain-containing protein n=1 Tax=Sulfurimonas sp. TaxID=2022749 RepID=UPI002624D1C2|nr:flagellar biosynthesis protein FlgL [Sulfurimonas sp.]MDD2653308.1 flagellar biosynthesis protein FlgL [Sulfurimonas sp.]MDD3450715.1 flagellar biosynthesis protein FlgL [Sulfurimonas sp.]